VRLSLLLFGGPAPKWPTDASALIPWGTGQGLLPDDSVLALTQTHDGYLWLGTLNGMVRFDGVRFTVFDESNTTNLPSIKIGACSRTAAAISGWAPITAGAALITKAGSNP
jgi:hypothetical protein